VTDKLSVVELFQFVLTKAQQSSPILYDALIVLLKQRLSIEEAQIFLSSTDITLVKFALSFYEDRFEIPSHSSLHQQAAEILGIAEEDLSDLTAVEEDEFKLMQSRISEANNPINFRSFFEFLRYNASLSLIDPNPFIRTTAQRVVKEYGLLPVI
jgi:hypothetical protein